MDKVFLVHFPLILEEDSANFMQVFQIKFCARKIKETRLAMY